MSVESQHSRGSGDNAITREADIIENDLSICESELTTTVVSFIDHLRDFGHRPNRTVAFMGVATPGVESGTCDGWLLHDRLSRDRPSRWLLLDDGHVWHETLYETREESYPECTWVNWHSDRLAQVLTLTLADMQRGGRGGLAHGDGHDRFYVHDRRRCRRPQVAADRRRRAD